MSNNPRAENPEDDLDRTYKTLKRTPFEELHRYCQRMYELDQGAIHNDQWKEFISTSGWTVDEISDEIDKRNGSTPPAAGGIE